MSQPLIAFQYCQSSSAKFLRSRDRTLNNEIYPRVHYPELYILEGGYCDFYDKCPVSTSRRQRFGRIETYTGNLLH